MKPGNEKPTSLQQELDEQQHWLVKGMASSQMGIESIVSRLIENEFRDAEEMRQIVWERMRGFLQHAVMHVPYYRELAASRGIQAADISQWETLDEFPLLTKSMLRRHGEQLLAEKVPEGFEVAGKAKSSGTTGEPVEVKFSRRAAQFFGLLKQRELRWFRFKPDELMAYIRPPEEFPHNSYDENTKTYHSRQWPYVGRWFQTSRSIGCDILVPVDEQLAWLRNQQVNYLTVEAGVLESLAFGQENTEPCEHLKGIQAVATQLTANMRLRAEKAFGLGIDQNYGLNEIGLVASRCPEGGRYHVHAEHCLVEIVDEEGKACQPGEMGRLLVTGINNLAMPLIRYDTDDMAEAVEGPCACGRTLPSFGRILGRYRRTAYLPGKTWQYWENFRTRIESMPAAVSTHFRQYQLHQYKNGSFEFRHVSAGEPAAGFLDYVSQSWRESVAEADPGSDIPLTIKEMSSIPKGMGRKYQNFTSEFSPTNDDEESPGDTQ